jgi:two-component system sensor histidine kinase/response regulator
MFKKSNRKYAWVHLLEKLSGNTTLFTMENRVFNAVSIITLVILFLFVVFNALMTFWSSVFLMGAVMLIQLYLYYLSRVKKRLSVSIVFFAMVSQVCLVLSYYYNSGMQGATLFGFFLTFQLIISVAPKRQHIFWFIVHICVATGLLFFQYKRPDLIHYVYSTRKEQYLDIAYTYITVLLTIYFITGYLKYSYENERRLTELQNKKLEKLNEEKDKIFSIVAHDLKSPLASIQGYLEMLMLIPEEQPDRNLQARLLDLTTNTSDMLANLLVWAKSQMQGSTVNIRELNLYQIVATVLSVQDTLARNKQITIKGEIDPEIMLFADREMLALVIRNLINNAIKFSPAGSTIFIRSKVENEVVFLSVKDEGIGIAAAQQQQLFSLKVTSSNGTDNEKGTGLGLALCKDTMEKMNGSISYEKSEPHGSIFSIALPLAPAEIIETKTPAVLEE